MNNKICQLEDSLDIDMEGESKLVDRKTIAGYLNYYFLDNTFFEIINANRLADINIDKKDISRDLKNSVYLSRNILNDFLNKYKDVDLYKIINKITSQSIQDKIFNSNLKELRYFKNDLSIQKMIDYKISLLSIFKKEEGSQMAGYYYDADNNIKNRLLNESEFQIKTDNEFYYIAGQLAYYLINQSEASNKTGRLLNGFYGATTHEKLKNEMQRLNTKYKHAIILTNKSIYSKLYSAFLNYIPESNLKEQNNKTLFEIGLFTNNLNYLKTQKSESDTDTEIEDEINDIIE